MGVLESFPWRYRPFAELVKELLLFFTEPNRSKGKSGYSLTSSFLRFFDSGGITIKERKIMAFLGPTGVLPTSRLPALVIRGRRGARWCLQKHPLL